MADTVDVLATRLAAGQYGLISRAQALELGFSASAVSRRSTSGRWELIQPCVYRIAGAAPSWRQRLVAACLAAGPGALVSHRSAAALWAFEGMATQAVEILSDRWDRRPRGAGIILHETQDLVAADRTVIDGIPVATPLRVALDIGCSVSAGRFEVLVNEGIRRGLFSHAELWDRYLEVARPGRNGGGPLGRLLRERRRAEKAAHSGWEIRLARLITRLGFPRPDRQVAVHADSGEWIAQVDLAYPELCIAIEADSETWHTGDRSFHRDRKRWNNITVAAGWELLLFTFEHYRSDHEHIRRSLRAAIIRQQQRLARRLRS